jgi:molybdopterin molybdotransferase
MASPLTLIPAATARRIMLETPPVGTEVVSLREAGGRVLAAPFAAREDLPTHARSVMDGYAVRASDVTGAQARTPAILRVVGTVPMGGVFAGRIASGETVGISTGGFLPLGADAVVMIEHTRVPDGGGDADGAGAGASAGASPSLVEIDRSISAGTNVIQRGEDVVAGASLLSAGRRLRPQDIAALATFGLAQVAVYRRPRIAVLSTGNELCAVTDTPAPGQVRDVNQWVLGTEVEATGACATYGGITRDDPSALAEAIARLLPTHDGLILSGGSSVGVKDVSGVVMGQLDPPGVLFHGIDIRPGKPTIFARVGDKPVIGMPGFPTSSMVVFDAFVRPMLWRLGGEIGRDPWPTQRRARILRAISSTIGREDYVRVRFVTRADQASSEAATDTWVEPLAGGSSAISNLIFADGLVRIEAACDEVAEGDWVDVALFS